MPKLLLAVAVTAALTLARVTPSLAQAAVEPGPLEEIVVVGSRTRESSALEAAVPVDVIGAAELGSSGGVAGELGEALAALVPSFNFPRQSNSGTSDLVRAGQLRGMSPDQMLVLVNGRRRHTSAIVNTETKIGRGTAAVDFNTIPLDAIDRIEVLRDGAGALYGSDAVAGVVNVILDETPGFDLGLSYGTHRTELEPVDESVTDGETVTLDAKHGWALPRGFFKIGAAYRSRHATNRAGFDRIPFFVAPTPANLALEGRRNYAEGDPNVDEVSAWFNGEIPVSGARFYTFGTLGSRESDGGAAFYRYPDSPANVREIHDEGFRPESLADDEDLSVTAGLRADKGAWALDGSVGHGRNRFTYGVENSLNASLGPASPTRFESGTYENAQVSLNFDARRAFGVAAFAGPVVLAAGAEYRREDYETSRGDAASFATGPFDGEIGAQAAPGLTPADEADLGRDVRSVYADVGAEFTGRLFADAAVRLEDYSDFGSAATGRIAARFELDDGLALRGAVSNSFRAPNVAQLGFADTSLNFGENRTLVRTRTLRVGSPLAAALGASGLDEEQADSVSIGLAGDYGGVSFSVDVFRVDVEDRITLSERLFGSSLVDFLEARPGGTGVESVRFFTNAVDTRTEGVDLVVGYGADLEHGTLELSAAWHRSATDVTRIAASTDELAGIDPALRLVGVEEINTLEDAAPEDKLVVSTTWSRGAWRATARASRFGETVRVFNFGGGFEPRQEYGAETQLDIDVDYRATDTLTLAFGIVNALDEYPDLSSADINFFGNLPYDILSPVGVNGRFVYTRLGLGF